VYIAEQLPFPGVDVSSRAASHPCGQFGPAPFPGPPLLFPKIDPALASIKGLTGPWPALSSLGGLTLYTSPPAQLPHQQVKVHTCQDRESFPLSRKGPKLNKLSPERGWINQSL